MTDAAHFSELPAPLPVLLPSALDQGSSPLDGSLYQGLPTFLRPPRAAQLILGGTG